MCVCVCVWVCVCEREREREREGERHLRPQGREVKARAMESLLRRSAHFNNFYFPLNPPRFPFDQHQNQFIIEIVSDKTVTIEFMGLFRNFYLFTLLHRWMNIK